MTYDGTAYAGFQVQPNARTVQGELERAIGEATDAREFELYGSGRTDAGVHALAQVAHLDIDTTVPPETLRRRINDALPSDINVLRIDSVRHRFHARGAFGPALRSARKVRGSVALIHVVAGRPGISRLGIAVTRRVAPSSVVRNRMKRVVRELFRRHPAKAAGLDLVASSCPGCSPINMRAARGLPSPKTVCVARLYRSHPVQEAAARRRASRVVAPSGGLAVGIVPRA